MIEYRKITITEKENVINLIKEVLNNLERKDFFMPFTEEELEDICNQEKIITYGAYDDDKIIGMAQLYIDQSATREIKELINLKSNKVAELGQTFSIKRI